MDSGDLNAKLGLPETINLLPVLLGVGALTAAVIFGMM